MKNQNIMRWLCLGLLMCLLEATPALAFYNPQQGRWISRDPIEENGGVSIYQFVQNDLLNHADTFGTTLFKGADEFKVFNGFKPKPIECNGAKIGELNLLMMVIDASNTFAKPQFTVTVEFPWELP